MSNVINFTPKTKCPRHAVALGNTRSGVWQFDLVASDEEDLSIAASNTNGVVMTIHPAPKGWAVVDEDGELRALASGPLEAANKIVAHAC